MSVKYIHQRIHNIGVVGDSVFVSMTCMSGWGWWFSKYDMYEWVWWFSINDMYEWLGWRLSRYDMYGWVGWQVSKNMNEG